MKPFQNYIVFSTDTLFNDKASFKGVNGREIVLDPKFDPQRHIRTYGEVVSVPPQLTKKPFMQEHRGSPAPPDTSPFEYKYTSDVVQDVQVGDRIYFHFNTMMMRNCVKEEGVHPNKTWYFKVSYEQVICAVRNGNIIPIGSYVLVDPDFETWDDILLPVMSGMVDDEGKPIPKPKEQWLQRKVQPEYKFLTAFVRHIGKPLRGDKVEVEVGQKVWYRRNADWINKIEGTEYFAIRQRHIVAKEVNGEFTPIRGHMLVIPEEEPDTTASGLLIKKKMTQKGVVFHPGESQFKVGVTVVFGRSDRQELELACKKYLLIKKGDVIATHERNAKP